MIIGHQKQWQLLKKSAELGKLSHAYLFSGPEKIGKKALAWQLVKWLFNDENIQKRPHPDFVLVEPERKEIKISQIRELILKLSLKPSLAPLKVGMIDQAHLMNEEAQNSFLKTLEEPSANTLLILITEYPEFLLPTIRSRTEIIKLYPVGKKELENYFREQGVEEKRAQLISQIAQGRPGVAIELLNEPQKLKEREELIKDLIRLTKSDLSSRFQYAQKISQSAQLKEILNLWLSFFRENLIPNFSKPESLTSERLLRILRKIQEIYFLISTTNVNPRLSLEILMLEL